MVYFAVRRLGRCSLLTILPHCVTMTTNVSPIALLTCSLSPLVVKFLGELQSSPASVSDRGEPHVLRQFMGTTLVVPEAKTVLVPSWLKTV